MKVSQVLIVALAVALALSLLVAPLALADSPERPREVVCGGATESGAGEVSVRATLGEPVVRVVSAGGVTVVQGFWHGGATGYSIYLPLVIRN